MHFVFYYCQRLDGITCIMTLPICCVVTVDLKSI